ncbi:MAG: DndE family protein [Salegentibacter mishustinae]|nr:DndE family protein [Salegentibacter mishustinae]
MFSHIRTNKENREVVSILTRKLNLGAENVISRIALTYSLSKGVKLNLNDIGNSGGKEYSKAVLFGENINYYIGLVAVHYDLYVTDKDIPRYLKMHIDDGLKLLNEEVAESKNIDGFEFLMDKIDTGLQEII